MKGLPTLIKNLLAKIRVRTSKSTISYIMLILLFTKVLGFVKIRIWAGLFGASSQMDIFWAAFTIPDMMFNVLISGSINAAIIPVFSSVLHKGGGGETQEKELVDLFFDLTLVFTTIFVILGIIYFFSADFFSRMLVGEGTIQELLDLEYRVSTADIDLLTKLSRLMILSPIFLGISTVISGYLKVKKDFITSSIPPLLYNVIIITFSGLFARALGLGVVGLSITVVLGSLAQLLMQLPALFKFVGKRFSVKVITSLAGSKTKIIKIFKLSFPRALGVFGEYVNLFVNRMISFTVTAGALSTYQYAMSLTYFPIHIISGSILQVALSHFSELYSKDKIDEFKAAINESLQMVMYLILPFVAILLVLRLPIVRLAYGTRDFDWWDTVFTSWGLALLSFSMIGIIGSSVLLRAFYSMRDTKTPLISTFLTIIINVLATYFLTNFFSHYADWRPIVGQVGTQLSTGSTPAVLSSFLQDLGNWLTTRYKYDYAVGGVAAGFTIAYLFEFTLDMILMNRKLKGIFTWSATFKPFLKKTFACAASIVAMYWFYQALNTVLDTSRTLSIVIILVLASGLGMVVFVLFSWFVKIPELDRVFKRFKVFIGVERD